MSTIRQKKLAPIIVENALSDKPLNKKELVVSVGYSEKSGEKKATEILTSKGVQEELAILGFDVETAKRVVGQIALEGENDNVKLKASEMIFKVHGTYAPEKVVNLNYDGNANEEALKKAEEAYLLTLDESPRQTESS